MEKKVIITAYYVSQTGLVQEVKWEKASITEARAYVEQNMTDIAFPKYNMEPTEKVEEGVRYDVTKLTLFPLSHIEIVDYTDGHQIAEEIDNNTNTE